jgi:hypothetical protein
VIIEYHAGPVVYAMKRIMAALKDVKDPRTDGHCLTQVRKRREEG